MSLVGQAVLLALEVLEVQAIHQHLSLQDLFEGINYSYLTH